MAGIMQCPRGLKTGQDYDDRLNHYGVGQCREEERKIGPITGNKEWRALRWNKWLLLLDIDELDKYTEMYLANWDEKTKGQGSRAKVKGFLTKFRARIWDSCHD